MKAFRVIESACKEDGAVSVGIAGVQRSNVTALSIKSQTPYIKAFNKTRER